MTKISFQRFSVIRSICNGTYRTCEVPSGARDMALALEIELPVNALTQNQTSLTDLIERAASGDTGAFEQIMILSQQRVMTMTWRMLGNEADARDAAQEVFLRVYKYLGRFKQNQDFYAWLYRITVNVCRDIARKRQQHSEGFMSLAGTVAEEALTVASKQEDAEQTLLHTQRRKLIARALATLPAKERASLILRDVEGLPTDEVARIMKSSSTTVRSQISSARKKIKIYCDQYSRRKERRP
jgi:RNA polymerase sigma-70 factor (ECF subfamily)